MSEFVLDVSVTVAWLRDEESTNASRAARAALEAEGVAHVPTLWRYELANVLVRDQQRGRITAELSEAFLDDLDDLLMEEHPTWSADSLIGHSQIHGLTTYDAAYLILAQRLALPLATNDAQLRAAAVNAEVPLL